jgi:hypothetical protein
MGFKGEPTGKHGHTDIVRNPEFQAFLSACKPMMASDGDVRVQIVRRFQPYERNLTLHPDYLVAIDGSPYVSEVDRRFPSTQVLYVKVASVKLDLARLNTLRESKARYIDPYEINRIEQAATALSFWFNGANLVPEGASTPKAGFRMMLRRQFASEQSRIGGQRFLIDTLYDACRLRQGFEGIPGNDRDKLNYDEKTRSLIVRRCANLGCEAALEGIFVPRTIESVPCPACGEPIYATDVLRLDEAFQEYQDNEGVLTRIRTTLEHLLALHYLLYVHEAEPSAIHNIGIVMDGALAIFGESAKFHRALMAMHKIGMDDCGSARRPMPVLFGIQKSGEVLDFANLLDAQQAAEDCIPNGSFLFVDDDLRYRYVSPRPEAYRNAVYGDETYYGQDVIVKTHAGRIFVLNLAYTCGNKAGGEFSRRGDPLCYPALQRALSTVEAVESGLYSGSSIPQQLAHKYASISHVPGGKVLDILAKQAIKGR